MKVDGQFTIDDVGVIASEFWDGDDWDRGMRLVNLSGIVRVMKRY